MTTTDELPLSGLRVLDFTQNLPGPYATMMLAALGAEVVKIEPPRGDSARVFPGLFGIANRGKKSVVVDLKDERGAAAVRRLVASADVLVEGFRPGVMQRLGCGPEDCEAINPRLVYCSISGYGQQGPYRDYPGHDINYQALTGVCHMMRDADGRPMGTALPIGDLSASSTAVTAILAALYARHATGRGRIIDVAIVDTLLSWVYVWSEGLAPSDARLSAASGTIAATLRQTAERTGGAVGEALSRTAGLLEEERARGWLDRLGDRVKRSGRWEELSRQLLHALPHYAIYRTADDRWLCVGIVDENKFWREFCETVGLTPLGRVPIVARVAAGGPIRRMIAASIARRDLDHWLKAFDRARVPVVPVLSVEEALADPQLSLRRPGAGQPLHVPWPLGGRIEGDVPDLGQHTAELLGHDG